ncbi:MAG: hypothetical protein MJE77_43415, partial [Proteobacteria bacterium]|nr:hypothetical protein [Pseudomonadota bacterium]
MTRKHETTAIATKMSTQAISLVVIALMLTMVGVADASSLVNGGVYEGAISLPGQRDSHTFTASAGESIIIQVADTDGSSFRPQVWLYGPAGNYITGNHDSNVARISRTVQDSGTHTVVVSDYHDHYTGNYNIYFAHLPGASDGGELPSGGFVADTVELGDLDSYTFDASAGESVIIQVADTDGGSFRPQV